MFCYSSHGAAQRSMQHVSTHMPGSMAQFRDLAISHTSLAPDRVCALGEAVRLPQL